MRHGTTILVKSDTTFWFSGDPITVQILDDAGDVLECNHAGAEEEELDYGYADSNKCDWVDDWHNSMVCDKCDWSEIIKRGNDYE